MKTSFGGSSPGIPEAPEQAVPLRAGPYAGEIAARYNEPAAISALETLGRDAEADDSPPPDRNRVFTLELPSAEGAVPAVVKAFSRQSFLKDLSDRRRGTRARRSWTAARALRARGIGTPAPIAFLERWQGLRLVEAYYVSELQDGISSFRNELARLYRSDPDCGRIMTLLQYVAEAIRRMHSAGILHNDLGNQNILLRRKGDGEWTDVQFIDLNRARIRKSLSLRERARDLSRISLPSDFLRVFLEMYVGEEPPAAFLRWERFFRGLFAFHTRTRGIRHPFHRQKEPGLGPDRTYPEPRDIWIWDERSGQAISTMRREERRRYYPTATDSYRVVASVTRQVIPVALRYRALSRRRYAEPVSMTGRIGVALRPMPATAEAQTRLLEALGPVPVMLHFYHHEPPETWEFLAGFARHIRDRGHPLAVGLVQNRQAILEPARWKAFAKFVLGRLDGAAEWVEIGHAINRVKWGIWQFREYRQMLEAVIEEAAFWPRLRLMGPAVIDFEYHYLLGVLDALPRDFRFAALSHHLHVDRRGAPENRQDGFSAEDKFTLARAIAGLSTACEDRLIVSEVCWPLKGTGVHSPVGSPYVSPGVRRHDPSVSEEDYADYMIRYLATALCSGMVERVYWWRLVARGFGLVDDSMPDLWRPRPAYAMLRTFLELLGQTTFVEKVLSPPGTHILVFRNPAGRKISLLWSWPAAATVWAPFPFERALSGEGRDLHVKGPEVNLSGHPLYLLEAV